MKLVCLVTAGLMVIATLSAQQANAPLTISVNVQPSCRIDSRQDSPGVSSVAFRCNAAALSRARVGEGRVGRPDVVGTTRPTPAGVARVEVHGGSVVQIDF